MPAKLISEPHRTHVVRVGGTEIIIESCEGEETLSLSIGPVTLLVKAEEGESIASVLMAHTERLNQRVAAR